MKWQDEARKIQRADSFKLKSLPKGKIIRKKFTVEAQEQMAGSRSSLEFDEDGVPTNIKPGEIKGFHKIVLKYGLLDTNFEDENGTEVKVDEDFIDKLFEYPDVEQEIFLAILEFNRPLAEKSNSDSETVPSGISQVELLNSDQEPPSPTDENPTEN